MLKISISNALTLADINFSKSTKYKKNHRILNNSMILKSRF